jgi:hypothetical protein
VISTELLLHTLITRGNYDELRGFHETISEAVRHMRDDDTPHDGTLLYVALKYAEHYLKYPTYRELEEFVFSSPHLDSKIDGAGMVAKRCRELSEASISAHQGSWCQILDDYTVAARQMMYVRAMKTAIGCISVRADLPTANGKPAPALTDAERVTAALKYLDEVRRKDFTLPPSSPEGSWKENADLSADALIDGLRDTMKERCYTGLRHVDHAVTIGPRMENRCVAIQGYTHHGKSLVMRTLAYNMAAAGKRVLYVALEESALNCWTRLSFLHAYRKPELDIPSATIWQHAQKRITPEHEENLRLLIDDLKFGKSVTGDIVVVTMNKWADVVRELETGHNGKPYDACFIDYIAHFSTGQTGQCEKDEIRSIFKAAQSLTQVYRGGRGLVIVHALQANKAGMKAADEEEGEDWGVYADGSIEQFTDAGRDADLIIGVWSKGLLKDQGVVKLSCLKNRGGARRFAPHFARIDARTGMIYDLAGGPKSDISMISTYKRAEEEAALSPRDIAAY